MADQKDGPYKVVGHLVGSRERFRYSIVVEQKDGFLKELVPDAGESQTARQLANLLNKNYKEVRENLESGKGWQVKPGQEYDFMMGIDEEGVEHGDQTEGTAG